MDVSWILFAEIPFISSWFFPFYRSAFRILYPGYPVGKQSFYNTLASLFYYLQLFLGYTPCRKPSYCFCEAQLSATSPGKYRWRLQPEYLPFRLRWRAYFLLPTSSVCRKIISLSVQDCTKGKSKKQFKLKIKSVWHLGNLCEKTVTGYRQPFGRTSQ